VLALGKTHFFALLKSNHRDPKASIDYQRSTDARPSEEAEHLIKHEWLREKSLIDNPELPNHDDDRAASVNDRKG